VGVQHKAQRRILNLAHGRLDFRRKRRELIVHNQRPVRAGGNGDVAAPPHQHMQPLGDFLHRNPDFALRRRRRKPGAEQRKQRSEEFAAAHG